MTVHTHRWTFRTVPDPRWPERTDTTVTEVYCAVCGVSERKV